MTVAMIEDDRVSSPSVIAIASEQRTIIDDDILLRAIASALSNFATPEQDDAQKRQRQRSTARP